MKWHDESTKRAQVFVAKAGELRIVVVKGHALNPDDWVLTCQPFFELKSLDCESAEDAKAIAIDLVGKALTRELYLIGQH